MSVQILWPGFNWAICLLCLSSHLVQTGCWYANGWWANMEGGSRIAEKNRRTEGTLEYPFICGLSCAGGCCFTGSLVPLEPGPGLKALGAASWPSQQCGEALRRTAVISAQLPYHQLIVWPRHSGKVSCWCFVFFFLIYLFLLFLLLLLFCAIGKTHRLLILSPITTLVSRKER